MQWDEGCKGDHYSLRGGYTEVVFKESERETEMGWQTLKWAALDKRL